jgi:hypothetical protein
MYLDLGIMETRNISYEVPVIYELTTYTGYVKTSNQSAEAGLQEKSTFLNLTVHPYFVDIISPTESQPYIGVTSGDYILVKVNVSYAGTIITSGVEWNVSLLNKTMSLPVSVSSSYNSTENLWWLNFTAPDLALLGYDLNVTANYTTMNLIHSGIEGKAIIYTDTILPIIDLYVPSKVATNTTVEIIANVTDSGGVKNVTAVITYPNNETEEFNLIRTARDWDVYTYELNFTNTSQLGIYKINVTACDMSGNCNSSATTFEVVIMIWFAGKAVNEEDISAPPLAVRFRFNESGKNETLFDFSSNATGHYNETIDAKTYDLKVNVWNETIELFSTPINTNVFNPIVFGKIKPKLIGKGSLKGMTINTTLNFSTVNLTFFYSEFSDISVSNLGIYGCDDWVRYTGCNSTWTRLGGYINAPAYTIMINLTNLTEAYALAEYVCGNNVCESDYGESYAVCPQDCPPPVAPPPTVVAPPAPAPAAPPPAVVPPPVPVEIKYTLIFVTLKPGEHEIHSIEVTNNLDREVLVDMKVEGNVWELVMIETPVFTIPPKSTEVVKIKLFALATTMPGTYTGDIVTTIREENITHKIPVTVKVELPPEPLLDVSVKALSKVIAPGDIGKFEVSLVNMGPTAKIEDILVTYTIKRLVDEKVVTREQETKAVEQVYTYIKSIPIPKNITTDRHAIEVNVSYWYGRKSALALDAFDISAVPPILIPLVRRVVRPFLLHWLTYVILFGVLPAIFLAFKLYKTYKERKAKAARYMYPPNLQKLIRGRRKVR